MKKKRKKKKTQQGHFSTFQQVFHRVINIRAGYQHLYITKALMTESCHKCSVVPLYGLSGG